MQTTDYHWSTVLSKPTVAWKNGLCIRNEKYTGDDCFHIHIFQHLLVYIIHWRQNKGGGVCRNLKFHDMNNFNKILYRGIWRCQKR